ncbi:hypothetical protein C1646_769540 [Rhizophagus diaphanus]|nr:hypothetical protein C1646_769540 [Rhizophagus diaphanus] [Rhizophagus sp. MUCL 43196]
MCWIKRKEICKVFAKNCWKKLTSKKIAQLENELAARAKWRNNFSTGCIRSIECKILTVNKENIYNKCIELNSDKNLKNVIIRPIPQIENWKFIPKYLVKKNPIFKYLKDSSLNEFYNSIDLVQDSDSSFWAILAEKGCQGVFKNKKNFKELCKIMVEIVDCEQRNKGNQNLENFANFITILASFETRGYEMFKQNLTGQTLRNIRLHHVQSDKSISNTDIYYENIMRFKKFANSLNYNGPVATIIDNMKLKESLSYSVTLSCVIGSTLPVSKTKVSNYEEVITTRKR